MLSRNDTNSFQSSRICSASYIMQLSNLLRFCFQELFECLIVIELIVFMEGSAVLIHLLLQNVLLIPLLSQYQFKHASNLETNSTFIQTQQTISYYSVVKSITDYDMFLYRMFFLALQLKVVFFSDSTLTKSKRHITILYLSY